MTQETKMEKAMTQETKMEKAMTQERLDELTMQFHDSQNGPTTKLDYHHLAELCRLQHARIAALLTRAAWTCLYCGEVTHDRLSARIHAMMCDRWPQRMEEVELAEKCRAQEERIDELQKATKTTHWKCFYCGDVAVDKPTAKWHAQYCNKWPQRPEEVELAEKCRAQEERIDELQKATPPTQWTCLYCGYTTRDKSTARLHNITCAKWPQRPEEKQTEELCKIQQGKIEHLERLLADANFSPDEWAEFCAPLADGRYAGMASPFQVPGKPWMYATDGKIAVRRPAAIGKNEETAGRIPRSIGDMPWDGNPDEEWEPWPAMEWSTDQQRACPQCEDQPSDDGGRCKSCLGSGFRFYQRVGKIIISSHYDRLIRALPNVLWRPTSHGEYSIVAFQFGRGSQGLVNGLHPEGYPPKESLLTNQASEEGS